MEMAALKSFLPLSDAASDIKKLLDSLTINFLKLAD
jgi:hypothetical protein